MKKLLIVVIMSLFPVIAYAQADIPTYTEDVGRIINDNCVVCHREGGIGPMSFTTFEEVRPWAPLISMRVETREMKAALRKATLTLLSPQQT
jgi:hypothetical protein